MLVNLLLIFIHIYGIYGCQNVYTYPKLLVQNPKHSEIIIHENSVKFKDGNEIYHIDPKNLAKIAVTSNIPFNNVSFKLPSKFHSYCNGTCDYQCIPINDNQTMLCGFTATLYGCPMSKKKFPPNVNIKDCSEQTPLAFLYKKDLKSNDNFVAFLLECWSSKHELLKYPFNKLEYLSLSFDGKKISALTSTSAEEGRTLYGICEYNFEEIINKLNNTKTKISVEDEEKQWRDLNQREFSSYQSAGFIFSRNYHRAKLDWDLYNNEKITSYAETSVEAIDQITYDIHFASISNKKILKGVTGNFVNITIELYCDIGEEILQMKVYKNEALLVLTKVNLYSLALHNCEQLSSCSKCISIRDPYCAWDKKLDICKVYNKSKNSKTLNIEYKQDIKNGNSEKQCSTDIEVQNFRLQEILTKFENIEEKLTKSSVNESQLKYYEKEFGKRLVKNITEQIESLKREIQDKNILQSKEIEELKNRNKILENLLNQISPKEEHGYNLIFITTIILFIVVIIIVLGCGYVILLRISEIRNQRFTNNHHITTNVTNACCRRSSLTTSNASTEYNDLANDINKIPSDNVPFLFEEPADPSPDTGGSKRSDKKVLLIN